MLTAKCSSCQTIPIIIRSKPSYWLLVLNFVTFLFGLTLDGRYFPGNYLCDTEIQADFLSKPKSLFCNVLLPELVGKYFTNSTNSDKSQDKRCICKMSEDEDDLIMCESKTCKIQWFHIKCMRIKKIPKGKWFCVKCKTKKKRNKKDN